MPLQLDVEALGEQPRRPVQESARGLEPFLRQDAGERPLVAAGQEVQPLIEFSPHVTAAEPFGFPSAPRVRRRQRFR